uniref:Uncharacterized protein n=1 Tax=Setaria viridis TaxID=4556 RepID=A0A4U6UXK1_SETVI|nr:hypothetical protein SEVIR_4G101201v2 [Setaria viridis]
MAVSLARPAVPKTKSPRHAVVDPTQYSLYSDKRGPQGDAPHMIDAGTRGKHHASH